MGTFFPLCHCLADERLDFWFRHRINSLEFLQPILYQHDSARPFRQVEVTVFKGTIGQSSLQHIVYLCHDALEHRFRFDRFDRCLPFLNRWNCRG